MRDWTFNHIDFSTYPYYDGDDLGVYLTEQGAKIKIWAPTALEIEFLVYRQSHGGNPVRKEQLIPGENGCWSIELQGRLSGLYYTFRVNDGEWLNETPGIDARAVGVNGKRGLFFRPEETNPSGWENDRPVSLGNPVDTILYELHVRDFSIAANSGMEHKGKFQAFTEKGTKSPDGLCTGIDHLKELGITHVHLLPVADFFSVDELHPDEKYNWGYDPLNYNTPEGSYALNPDDLSRITGFKQLVMALHESGIGVVMDVVYNHTGYTRRSWFNQTVPGYYYRQNPNGTFSNATGCGNEIASERAMVRKFIIDSICYWANEYHIDGFRFDLMGVMDSETMNAVRLALDQLRPGILLYGEGWTADSSPMPEQYRAVKANVASLDRIACFNDDFRDALKGNNFDGKQTGFVSGKTLNEEAVKFGVAAACYHPQIVYSYVESSSFAWADQPGQCVNYVSCHDNYTLFDKLMLSRPDAEPELIVRMQKLAGALVLTSQGIPFLHAGVEFCRTKSGQHNSYKSPDRVNQLDWSRKKEFQDVFLYYQRLIHLRKRVPAFRLRSASAIRRHLKFSLAYQPGVVSYIIEDCPGETSWKTIQLVFNASEKPISIELPRFGKWTVIADETRVNLEGIREIEAGQAVVSPVSMMILAAD
ncbi:type I pullulanase [Gaoshiqia sp. Z1-71]|uniref:type I pullulanase n=1 Tax=Gaoshiqia hydrogeniformans TaxID=3290090 RepID=UPI003BF77DEE